MSVVTREQNFTVQIIDLVRSSLKPIPLSPSAADSMRNSSLCNLPSYYP